MNHLNEFLVEYFNYLVDASLSFEDVMRNAADANEPERIVDHILDIYETRAAVDLGDASVRAAVMGALVENGYIDSPRVLLPEGLDEDGARVFVRGKLNELTELMAHPGPTKRGKGVVPDAIKKPGRMFGDKEQAQQIDDESLLRTIAALKKNKRGLTRFKELNSYQQITFLAGQAGINDADTDAMRYVLKVARRAGLIDMKGRTAWG